MDRREGEGMGEVLIVYSPTEEHVAVAAQQLRRAIERQGHEARACRVDEAPTAPMGYDVVLVGISAVPQERHDDLVRWLRGNREQLARRDTACFEVALSAPGTTGAVTPSVTHELEERAGWRPRRRWAFVDYVDVDRCASAEVDALEGHVPVGSA